MHASRFLFMFYEEGDALNTSVRPKGCTQHTEVRILKKKYLFLFTRKPQRFPLCMQQQLYLHLFVQGDKPCGFKGEG